MADGIRLKAGRKTYTYQIGVPGDLFGKVKGASGKAVRIVEVPLGTADRREALRKAAEARARQLTRFESIRKGLPLPDADLDRVAEEEHRRAFDLISAHYLDFHGKLDDLLVELGFQDLAIGMDGSRANPLLNGVSTTYYVRAKLIRLGREPTKESVTLLAESILGAQSAAVEMIRAGRTPPPLPGKPAIRSAARTGRAPRVSELVETYLASRAKLSDKTRKQARASIDQFATFADDPRVDAIDRVTVAAWAASLDSKGDAAATVNKHVSMVARFWQWAQDMNHVDEVAPNPFRRHRREVSEDDSTWMPFEPAELRKLLRPSEIRKHVLVALLTGMRASEIPAAEVKGSGTLRYFELGRGKTKAARRRIPVHPAMHGIADDWPEIRKMPGDTISEKFTAWRRECGIADDEKKKFHSLRKNFNEALVSAGVALTIRQALMGHKSGSLTDSVYLPNGPEFKLLIRAVRDVRYKGLKLPASN
jgi:integrase